MSFDFNEYISLLNAKLNLKENEIFIYDNSPLKLACSLLYNGFYNIQVFFNTNNNFECYFYISSNKSANAGARIDSTGIGVVKINAGLVNFWFRSFIDNKRLNKCIENDRLNSLDKSIGGLGRFLFSMSSLFTYYHELAHIIQNENHTNLPTVYQEKYLEIAKDNGHKQINEFDADVFAALKVTNHLASNLLQYFLEASKIDLSIENLIGDIIAFAIIGIEETFYNFQAIDSPIRVNENVSHPHPVLRLVMISTILTEELVPFAVKNNSEVSISKADLVKSVQNLRKYCFNKDSLLQEISKNVNNINFDAVYYLDDVTLKIKTRPEFATYHLFKATL